MMTNGNWRGWLLGIVATLIATMIGNDILFQRETREAIARHDEQLKRNSEKAANILKYLEQRIMERTGIPFNREDADREFKLRDDQARKLEHRVDELEKKRQ